jgi:hypothetical protein
MAPGQVRDAWSIDRRSSAEAPHPLLRAALKNCAAGRAKVATVMRHAGADTLNVRDILVAEPHRVWFASRALLRGPLLRSCRQRRACEHETEKRKGCDWSQIQCGANSHPGPPLVRSASSITVNSTGVAITQQRMSGPLRPRPAPPHRGRAAARRARCSVAARPRRAARARPAAP